MNDSLFHPAVTAWFRTCFEAPSPVQAAAWPAIARGGHTLLAAPTGSGKTLAAFLAAIDGLLREGLEQGLADHTQVLYVSPLKALSTDIQLNLQGPLMGIADQLSAQGLPAIEIRAWVRTGDTPQSERHRMRRRPPHILVTTPESLYILLTSASGRDMLRTARTLILDELHALAGSKRGAHLALSLERLEALTRRPLQRIGISATQGAVADMARFLLGTQERVGCGERSEPHRWCGETRPVLTPEGICPTASPDETAGEPHPRPPSVSDQAVPDQAPREPPCTIIDLGHNRPLDLGLELPASPLEAIMAAEVWNALYDRLADLAVGHRTTLIFVNTRRLAERVAHHLLKRLGEGAVMAHHGSLAREQRLEAEGRLKAGELRALVATASLELGIDIGDIELVCQLGSPRSVAALLQRVGRSGHALTATPKGRLFPLSRDDLAECTALLAAARTRRLDRIRIPHQPLDVLAQQIVAEVAAQEWDEQALFERLRRAWPYRELPRATFDQVTQMLADGFSTRIGRRAAYLHRDRINGQLRGRKGARLTAITNGGTIPDRFDYDVLLMPEEVRIGTLNEDFAFESLPGDIFQLGNTSYRILRIQSGRVLVEDARGQPPNIPFWFGEAPGRDDLLSAGVSALRAGIGERLEAGGDQAARAWLSDTYGLTSAAADQLLAYYGAAQAALGLLPTQDRIVLERFFDEVGDMHLVVHSPYGSRLNRAWGLALRKRFCRTFNFELQAAALDDCIILSLGAVHSFALEDVKRFLTSDTVRQVLTQALLDVPLFATHWRWNVTTALAVQRYRGGNKVPPQIQRSAAEDLVALIFPDQLACLENIQGERELPDHPLVAQTLADCLTAVMDAAGLERLLRRIESGAVQVIARDLTAPSPLAAEIIGARPYAFLDDTPAEERRTLAVRTQGSGGRPVDQEDAARLARPDPAAIARVREQAWPDIDNPDELHDALLLAGFLTWDELGAATGFFTQLAAAGRAARLEIPDGATILCATERLPELAAIDRVDPAIAAKVPAHIPLPTDPDSALRELIRGRLECLGPVRATDLARPLNLPLSAVEQALAALEQEGFAVRGRFDPELEPDPTGEQWCERRLLARINRYTVEGLRKAIAPVSPAAYMRFLLHWQGLGGERVEGIAGTSAVLDRLAGFCIPAAAWETEILPARIAAYTPDLLDHLTANGRYTWLRLQEPRTAKAPLPPGESLPRAQRGGLGRGHQKAAKAPLPPGERLPRVQQGGLGKGDQRATKAPLPPGEGLGRGDQRVKTGTFNDTHNKRKGRSTPNHPPSSPNRGGKTLVRTTPIAILRRDTVPLWRPAGPPANPAHSPAEGPSAENPAAEYPVEKGGLSSRAQLLLDLLRTRGARFFADLVRDSGLLRTEVATALGELVAAGQVTADGFAGLRALIAPAARGIAPRRRRGSNPLDSLADPLDRAGRWDALPDPRQALPSAPDAAVAAPSPAAPPSEPPPSEPPPSEPSPSEQNARLEALAHQLLQRYGLVLRRTLERERGLPPWRDLLRAYWRLEARGEIRGGRFVTGFSGEQFAHPEAVAALRRHREAGPETPIVISATDPINLTGILTPGERIPATLGNRILYRQGIPVAARIKGQIRTLATLRPDEERQYRQLLTQERKNRTGMQHRREMGRGW